MASRTQHGPRPPSEASEHRRLEAALRRASIYHVHVPMGGARGRKSGAEARRMGARKGFPDFLILDPPPGAIRLEDQLSEYEIRAVDGAVVVARGDSVVAELAEPTSVAAMALLLGLRPGTAIELKRTIGGRLSKDQRRELQLLSDRGWRVAVCAGADEALETLRAWGYEL